MNLLVNLFTKDGHSVIDPFMGSGTTLLAAKELGGLEEELKVAFNDVDFCLRAREKGYLVVYDPNVELYHFESKSRGTEDSKEKIRRFQNEIEYMRSRWLELLKKGDPMYNPNLTLTKWDYSLRNNQRE